MGFRTVCIDSLCKCTYKGGYLVVTKDNDIKKIHISEISTKILSELDYSTTVSKKDE